MRNCLTLAAVLALLVSAPAGAADIAAGDTLRAVYLRGNPAQAVRDPATGETRGPSADLACELARRNNLALDLQPIVGPPDVIEAVRGGKADIGFVAYETTRLGTVEFSQNYMLVQQSFLVPDGSALQSVREIDRAGIKAGGRRNDSITLCMKRVLKAATVVELENTPDNAGIVAKLKAGEIDAFGANRQTLTNLMKSEPGTRLLADDFFYVPQTIIVPMGKPAALAAVNTFIDEVRASGFLKQAIDRAPSVSSWRRREKCGTAALGEPAPLTPLVQLQK